MTTPATARNILHPLDTAAILREASDQSEHLWYRVHYDQQYHDEEIKEMNDKKIKNKNPSQTQIDKIKKETAEEIKYLFRKKLKPVSNQLDSLKLMGARICQSRLNALQAMEDVYDIRVLHMKARSLFIHGIGASHVRENGLTIHPIYGIPYIPGSSVKGVVRRWFIDALLNGQAINLQPKSQKEDSSEPAGNALDSMAEGTLEATEKQAAKRNAYTHAAAIGRALFGTEAAEGIVQFYDILMYEGLNLQTDVLTPHFSKYYSGGEQPTDLLEPVPNVFYAVEITTATLVFTMDKFRMSQVLDPLALTADQLLKLTVKWTQMAMQQSGVGGKTSSGYGLFFEIEDVTEARLKDVRQQQADRRRVMREQRESREQELHEQRERRQRELREQQERESMQLVLAAMSPDEQLIYQIEQLTASQNDIHQSKDKIYKNVESTRNVAAARKLKQYWLENKQWNTTKKQVDKCIILEELIKGLDK